MKHKTLLFLALCLGLSAPSWVLAQEGRLDTLAIFFKPGEYELPVSITLPRDAQVVGIYAGADRWEAGDAIANAPILLARARNLAAAVGLPSFTLNVLTGNERVAMVVFRHNAVATAPAAKFDIFPWLLIAALLLVALLALLYERRQDRRHRQFLDFLQTPKNQAPPKPRPMPSDPSDPDLWGEPVASSAPPAVPAGYTAIFIPFSPGKKKRTATVTVTM